MARRLSDSKEIAENKPIQLESVSFAENFELYTPLLNRFVQGWMCVSICLLHQECRFALSYN
jgi:hypothetical protein